MRSTASWAALGLMLAGGSQAMAQEAPPVLEVPDDTDLDPAPDTVPDAAAASPAAADAIIVTGARASQISANARKRNARTATDSIVADDIGSFPDRNVNEAISRIPGVALGRNEFGEGDSISIRGNGPDLTRVELDGMGVQATNALALGASRSADLREVPAELVKSIDVVKGSTADMTEGSIGGTVQIRTRTGLDFQRPYVSVRAGVSQNSLGKDWTPDFNAVAANKFFDDRLGVIVSGTYSKLQNNGHAYETTTSGNRGYARFYDFDQSPEKTFEYNIDTLGTDLADQVFGNSTLTPRDLLTRSISAQTKAECFDVLPFLDTTSAAQRNQRTLEQRACLAQWYDATPSLIRNFVTTQTDERYSIDGRVDFRITDNWTVFGKATMLSREVDDQFRSRNPLTLFSENAGGTFDVTAAPPAGPTPRQRSVAPGAPEGYFLFDPQYALRTFNNQPTVGDVLNVRPDSIMVDDLHNVTAMTLTNNSVNIDQIENFIDTKSSYVQFGTEYYTDRIELEAFVGMTKSENSRADMRTSRSYQYGDAQLELQENGLWDIQLPPDYDETDPTNFVQLSPANCLPNTGTPPNCIAQNAVAAGQFNPATPAFTVGDLPLTTPNFGVSYSPRIGEASEKIAKFDVGYDTVGLLPFITRFKTGAMYRKNEIDAWGGSGYTVSSAEGTFGQPGFVPAVVVPRALIRGTLRACQPTATSIVSCNYGFVPNPNPALGREGQDTLTPEELTALFAETLEEPDSEYFGDLPNRGNLPDSWQGIKTDELFAQLGASQFMNFDCVKTCVGSDGQVYDQPVTSTREEIKNIYGMFDFEQELPMGLVFNGNIGLRGVFRKVEGTGFLVLNSIQTTPSFNPADPDNPGGIITRTFSQNTTLNAETTDWLPSANLNLWAFNEQVVFRLYGAKTVALPNPGQLVASGTCTVDQRLVLTGDDSGFGCSGRVGNPALSPFTAWSYNASLEWYPNSDTLLSVAYGKLDVKIGNPISVTETARPFEGSDQIDPGTGLPLSDFEFNYPTFADGPGYKRDIWEFAGKTAFTFLPSFLQYTGVDANISILGSSVTSGQQDPLSGDIMPVPGESKYTTNVSLWYDDGKLNARIAFQKRSERFDCITPCGGNNIDFNYPGEQWTNVRLAGSGYSPGIPRFIYGTEYIDAKIAYNINRNFQVYLEGRNLRKEAQIEGAGEYYQFADGTDKVMRLRYGGRRLMAGVRVQFGN